MGNNSNKKIKNELGAKIGKSFNCPLCNKIFSSNTTFASVKIKIGKNVFYMNILPFS